MDRRCDAVVVGSGFSGSLLARILSRAGWRVVMVDASRHPRFALGESTTPLGNLALERLARRYGLDELWRLATHGRWLEAYPEVHRGLKRGFSFYGHRPGERWTPAPERRLLVAASPNDRLADTHWLRADVDHLLAKQAVADGVELLESTRLEGIEPGADGLEISLEGPAGQERLLTALAIDASGPAAAVARRMGASMGPALRTASALLFGHFRGVRDLGEATGEPAALADAPYPEDRAAVHHLLEEGWLYLLRFDHGTTSAGLLLDLRREGEQAADLLTAASADPEGAWNAVVERYPTLAALFAGARAERPIAWRPRVQHRLSRSHGPRWVAMPHTFGFVDPLFSTGIAWSLRGVERLAEVLLESDSRSGAVASGTAFEGYSRTLARELEQSDRLISAAYASRRHFELFSAHSLLYFARVSFAEAFERFAAPPAPWREDLLGSRGTATGPSDTLFEESTRRLEAALAGAASSASYESWVAATIEAFNVAGLAEASRGNLYGVDLDELLASSHKLGVDAARLAAELAALGLA